MHPSVILSLCEHHNVYLHKPRWSISDNDPLAHMMWWDAHITEDSKRLAIMVFSQSPLDEIRRWHKAGCGGTYL